jgi:ribosomal protein S12 methylthiotransferase accessory factor YcaO
MQDEQQTCGKGLAANAALPERIGALMQAMAELLQNHTRSLNLSDANAALERNAYDVLIQAQRDIASRLDALAATMRSYRDLPIGKHDERALTDQTSLDVFGSFIRAEQNVVSLLQQNIATHRAMLGVEEQ